MYAGELRDLRETTKADNYCIMLNLRKALVKRYGIDLPEI